MSYEIVPGRPDASGGSAGAERRTPAERPITGERPVSEVGAFRQAFQGTETSQSALRRYLLTRALGTSIVRTVQWSGVAILAVAVLIWFAGITWLAVLLGLLAVAVLVVRRVLSAVQRSLSGSAGLGDVEPQLNAMVSKTRRGLRAELRRVGLPGTPWGPLLIGLRLIRPVRRVTTVRKLSSVDLTKVVPASRLDELQLLLDRARL